jgi:hypothetical protein
MLNQKRIIGELIRSSSIDENVSRACSCSNCFLDKRLIMACVISSAITGIGVFWAVHREINLNNDRTQLLSQELDILRDKTRDVSKDVASLETIVNSLAQESKNTQEKFTYLYSKIALIQKDTSHIKKSLHVLDEEKVSEDKPLMSPDQNAFIDQFMLLVQAGTPFLDFLKSYEGKLNLDEYPSKEKILHFADQKVLSVEELQQLIRSVGEAEFGIRSDETFWDRQKRVIKEKIVNAVTIGGGKKDDDHKDAQTLFSQAVTKIQDGEVSEAISSLEQIKDPPESLRSFMDEAKKRDELAKVAETFRTEFSRIGFNVAN